MRYRAPFNLFKKTLNSGAKVYYYVTYDKMNRRKQFSTGCKTKSEALKYCFDLFKKDELINTKNILFTTYTKDWYIYDKCPYVQSLLARGKTFSKSNTDFKRSTLVNRMYPFFKRLRMNEIKSSHIEDWVTILRKAKLSNNSINRYLSDLKTIFREAQRLGDIETDPGITVKRLPPNTKLKETLTADEVNLLLDPDKINTVWLQEVYYIINLLASKTGMRIGEIQALKSEDIKDDHIFVSHSWDKAYGLQGTKSGKSRIIPIDQELIDKLENYITNCNYEGPFIFSKSNEIRPIARFQIYQNTYRAFKKIGINEEKRKKRNITIHSWRHFYNTQLIKKGIPLPIIQAIIGHSSDKMTEHYTKLTKDDLAVVLI